MSVTNLEFAISNNSLFCLKELRVCSKDSIPFLIFENNKSQHLAILTVHKPSIGLPCPIGSVILIFIIGHNSTQRRQAKPIFKYLFEI